MITNHRKSWENTRNTGLVIRAKLGCVTQLEQCFDVLVDFLLCFGFATSSMSTNKDAHVSHKLMSRRVEAVRQ